MDKAFTKFGRSHFANSTKGDLTAAVKQHTERRSRLVSALDDSIRVGRPLKKFEGKKVPFGLHDFSYVAGRAHFKKQFRQTISIDDSEVGNEDDKRFWERLGAERREMCRRAV
jgi:hypothetical protein